MTTSSTGWAAQERLAQVRGQFPVAPLDARRAARRVPAEVTLPALPAAEAVAALPPWFGDGCLSCPLFVHCRAEQQAAGTVARTGSAAANLCGDVGTVAAALDLAEGSRAPAPAAPAEDALATDLGRTAAAWHWAAHAAPDEPAHGGSAES